MIAIQHLSKSFGRKKALEDVNLNLEQRTYGLLGPNGAGKTTLMKCIAEIYRYAGTISLDGQPVGRKNRISDSLGYLPQTFMMYKELSVYEAMEYMLTIKRAKGDHKKDIEACLARVNLEDKAKSKVRALSGGMLRRLGIAQALLGDPKLVIVDEPTAGLDPEERMRFKNIVRTTKENRTFIISTHILEDVEAVCDEIIVMNEGKILGVFTPEELAAVPEGKVFDTVDEEIPEKAVVLKIYEKHGEKRVRYIDGENKKGMEPVSTNLEDGFIYLIKGCSTCA